MRKMLICLGIFLSIYTFTTAADFPEIKGWTSTSEVTHYTPENLWEYINGAADQFLDYEFQFLRSREFKSDTTSVTIDIYDMGTPLNAFGMYTTERPIEYTPIRIGVESIISPPSQCLLLQGQYYVKVYAFEGEITENSGKSLLTSLADGLPGENNFTQEIAMLPVEGRISGSEGFVLEGYLGLSELNGCVFACYKDKEGKEFHYFYVILPSNDNFDALAKKLSEKWTETQLDGNTVLYRKIPYQGITGLIHLKKGVLGVSEASDESELLRRLKPLTTDP